jgi:hypothetical protein
VRLPDGSERFVVDEALLLETTARLEATLVDPIKTTNVQQQRCMTTWVMEKPIMRAFLVAMVLCASPVWAQNSFDRPCAKEGALMAM